MAFPAETNVLTNKGWKPISDISGHDRVLVRNFLGDAQFTQPFAVRRRDYHGKMISGGSSSYQFRVTPEHTVVYTDKGDNVIQTTAEDVPAKRENRLKHRSRYSTDTYLLPQKIRVKNFEYTVDTLDWYKLCGFVLRRGGMDKGRNRLMLSLDKSNPQKDFDLITPILNNLQLKWTFSAPNTIIISQSYNIANKIALMLGSKHRKEMFLPDRMIYSASIEQGRELIEMFIRTSRRDGRGVHGTTQFSTTNVKLIESLEILGLLCGYTISSLLVRKAGTKVPAGETKRDSYAVYVRKSVNEVSIVRKSESEYSGKVYEIDMFEDQLLIKEDDSLPIWMKPK